MFEKDLLEKVSEFFIGRDEELRQVKEGVRQSYENRTATVYNLIGMGDVGKTYLLAKLWLEYHNAPGTEMKSPAAVCGVDFSRHFSETANFRKDVVIQLAAQLLDQSKGAGGQMPNDALQYSNIDIEIASGLPEPDEIANKYINSLKRIAREAAVILLFDEVVDAEENRYEDYLWVVENVINPAVKMAGAVVILTGRIPTGKHPAWIDPRKQYRLAKKPEIIGLHNFSLEQVS